MRIATIFTVVLLMMAIPAAAQDMGSVSGSVSTEDGAAIAGANIILVGERGGNHMPDRQITQTDDEGNFRFAEVEAGAYAITAVVARVGHQSEQIEVAAGEETVVEFVFGGDGGGGEEGIGSIVGVVLNQDDEPVARATVTITQRNDHGRPLQLNTHTDGEGAFAFAEARAGIWAMLVVADQFQPFHARLEVEADAETEIVVNLEPMDNDDEDEVGGVAGTVSNTDDEAVPGAVVTIMREGGNRHEDHRQTQSDENGEFAFENVGIGEWNFVTLARGYEMYRDVIEVAEGEVTEVDVVLEPFGGDDEDEFGGVAGTVGNQDGEAIAGAQVVLMRRGHGGMEQMRTRTDDEGAFAFEEVAAGNWRLMVQAEGYRPYEEGIAVAADEVTEVDVVLRPMEQNDPEFGGIAGVVVNAEGEAVAGAVVALMTRGHNGHRGQIRLRTNEEGAFAIEEAAAGHWMITVTADGYVPFVGEFEVAADEVTELEIELQPFDRGDREFGGVAGTVTDPDGEPIAHAEVNIIQRGDHHRGHHLAARTDEEGRFAFERVPTGEWHYIVHARGYNPAEDDFEVAVDEVTELEIELEPFDNGGGGDGAFGSVAGVVADVDGEAIARAEIMLVRRHDGHRRPAHIVTRSDAEGMYAFERVQVGVWQVIAGRIGFEPFEGEVEVEAEQETELNIVLEPVEEDEMEFGSVFGVVTDEEGEPIELAHVRLMPQRNNDRRGWHNWHRPMLAFTDEDGAYEFERVPVADYVGRAAKRGYQFADEEFSVQADEATEVNFVLEAHERGDGDDRGGRNDHRRVEVELEGSAMVVAGDRGNAYFIDVDGNGEADFLLNFGPPDYQPDNGAERPEDGDEIAIRGIRVGHMEPMMVIVLEINGEVWRDIDRGHGAARGRGEGWGRVAADAGLVVMEGFKLIRGDRLQDQNLVDIDEDGQADYRLFFGDDTYDPNNGAERPQIYDFVNIVGAEFQAEAGLSVIVVYQIDGLFWREPGNTDGLYWADNEQGVEQPDAELPVDMTLLNAYPNPFNPSTTVSFTLPLAGNVRLALFDLRGREVTLVSRGYFAAGQHSFLLNGASLKAGTYFLRLNTPSGTVAHKVTLLK